MSELTLKPKPPDSDLSRPYWNAASNGQLMIQKCGCCGALRHYPRLICDQCYSCLLYTSPSPRDVEESRMPSSA